jgi:hypothetical protein
MDYAFICQTLCQIEHNLHPDIVFKHEFARDPTTNAPNCSHYVQGKPTDYRHNIPYLLPTLTNARPT